MTSPPHEQPNPAAQVSHSIGSLVDQERDAAEPASAGPTPRTDAAERAVYSQRVEVAMLAYRDLARQLEMELTEAIAMLDEYQQETAQSAAVLDAYTRCAEIAGAEQTACSLEREAGHCRAITAAILAARDKLRKL